MLMLREQLAGRRDTNDQLKCETILTKLVNEVFQNISTLIVIQQPGLSDLKTDVL